jgi:hypothetical protein
MGGRDWSIEKPKMPAFQSGAEKYAMVFRSGNQHPGNLSLPIMKKNMFSMACSLAIKCQMARASQIKYSTVGGRKWWGMRYLVNEVGSGDIPLSSPSAMWMTSGNSKGNRKADEIDDRNAANVMTSVLMAMRFVVTWPSLSNATSGKNKKQCLATEIIDKQRSIQMEVCELILHRGMKWAQKMSVKASGFPREASAFEISNAIRNMICEKPEPSILTLPSWMRT